MPVSVLAAAKRMGERSGWSLSNLELQKMLYIAQMFHIGETGQPLVLGNFEAWDYGPVHPTLYHRIKIFGADPVKNIFHSVSDIADSAPEAVTIDSAVEQLSGSQPGELVAITHSDIGAWASYYVPGERGIVIPNEAILREFNARREAARTREQAENRG